MFTTIYILSLIIGVAVFIWDELRCSGELHLVHTLSIVAICVIPVVNTIILLWFMFDEVYMTRGDIVIYRRKDK